MVLIDTAHITFLFGTWYILILIKKKRQKKKLFPEDVSLQILKKLEQIIMNLVILSFFC